MKKSETRHSYAQDYFWEPRNDQGFDLNDIERALSNSMQDFSQKLAESDSGSKNSDLKKIKVTDENKFEQALKDSLSEPGLQNAALNHHLKYPMPTGVSCHHDPVEWYDNDKINFLLSYYLANNTNINLFAAMDGDNSWSEILDYNLDAYLKSCVNNKSIVIPTNIHGNHWVLLWIDEPVTKTKISYFDPYALKVPGVIIDILKKHFGKPNSSLIINELSHQLQPYYNSDDCGPWIIECALSQSNKKSPPYRKNIQISRERDHIIYSNKEEKAQSFSK